MFSSNNTYGQKRIWDILSEHLWRLGLAENHSAGVGSLCNGWDHDQIGAAFRALDLSLELNFTF